jgi:hypothetical protein
MTYVVGLVDNFVMMLRNFKVNLRTMLCVVDGKNL